MQLIGMLIIVGSVLPCSTVIAGDSKTEAKKIQSVYWIAGLPQGGCESREGTFKENGYIRQENMRHYQGMNLIVQQPTFSVLQSSEFFTTFLVIAETQSACEEGVKRARSIGR
jgi:hypothetical protein